MHSPFSGRSRLLRVPSSPSPQFSEASRILSLLEESSSHLRTIRAGWEGQREGFAANEALSAIADAICYVHELREGRHDEQQPAAE